MENENPRGRLPGQAAFSVRWAQASHRPLPIHEALQSLLKAAASLTPSQGMDWGHRYPSCKPHYFLGASSCLIRLSIDVIKEEVNSIYTKEANKDFSHPRCLLLLTSQGIALSYTCYVLSLPTSMSLFSHSHHLKCPFNPSLLHKPLDVHQELVYSPGWRGSVDWALVWEPKGHWFDSQSGHMPGLQAKSSVWELMRGNHTLMFLSLSFSLLSPLSKNK